MRKKGRKGTKNIGKGKTQKINYTASRKSERRKKRGRQPANIINHKKRKNAKILGKGEKIN